MKLCWECGKKLRGNKKAEKLIHGYAKILHLECARKLDKATQIESYEEWSEEAIDAFERAYFGEL